MTIEKMVYVWRGPDKLHVESEHMEDLIQVIKRSEYALKPSFERMREVLAIKNNFDYAGGVFSVTREMVKV